MRLLITGSSGFVGEHLIRAAAARGGSVVGLDITPPRRGHASDTAVRLCGSFRDRVFFANVLADVRPTHVVHMAGTLPGTTIDHLTQYETNTLGTVDLFETVVSSGLGPVMLVNSSSAVYGRGPGNGIPIPETAPLAPLTHYGVSKAAQEMIARRYGVVNGLPVIVTRTFNLMGPGQSPTLLASDVARQIAIAERSNQPATVRVGDLSPRRDFVDARDGAEAYLDLLERGRAGETYNVCAGVSHSADEVVETLCALARVPVEVQSEAGRRRDTEIEEQVGDFTRVRVATGWEPRVPFRTSLLDLLEDWRERCQKGENA